MHIDISPQYFLASNKNQVGTLLTLFLNSFVLLDKKQSYV